MKRKAVATEFKYSSGMYRHHGGPIAKAERERRCDYEKPTVNKTRINKEMYRQWKAKNFVAVPRLIKKFHLGTIGESKIVVTVTR